MSGVLVGDVFKCAPADLTSGQMLVLLALAEDARTGDRIARYSSLASLATKTRQREGSVKNALTELARRGLITKQGKGHRGRVQHYRLADLAAHHRASLHVINGSLPDDPMAAGKGHR